MKQQVISATNLHDLILEEHTKSRCNEIVNWVGNDQHRFNVLFDLFLGDEYRVTQRAAWPVSYAVIAHPGLMSPHWKRFIKNLDQPGLPDAVKRNSVRLLQFLEIPRPYHGAVMNHCFEMVASPTETVAVKVFSLSVLSGLAKHYPEIIPEIRLIIENELPTATAAFKSRANKVLKELGKL